METFEFYVRLPKSQLKTLLNILKESSAKILTAHPDDEEIHITVIGTAEAYNIISEANIAQSLEHFQDDI